MSNRTSRRNRNFESLEKRELFAADLGLDLATDGMVGPATAEVDFVEVNDEAETGCCFIKSWSISGDADDRPTEEVAFYYNKIAFGYAATSDGEAFSAAESMEWNNVSNLPWDHHSIDPSRDDSGEAFSFGVEREMKESGEKGGTEDINIGVGELQECTISKSMDAAPAGLAQLSPEDIVHGDYFIADSFSFGVEREMKESGEKGGTEDINIGVGELQECTTSKSMDGQAVDEMFSSGQELR